MSATLLPVLGKIRDQLKRLADLAEPTKLILADKPVDADEFIEILDDKGRTHHFHRRDLKNYRDGFFQYEPQGGFYTALTAKEIKAIVEPTPDVPTDTLVEAAQAVVSAYIPGDMMLEGPIEGLKSALDAHEKEKSHER